MIPRINGHVIAQSQRKNDQALIHYGAAVITRPQHIYLYIYICTWEEQGLEGITTRAKNRV